MYIYLKIRPHSNSGAFVCVAAAACFSLFSALRQTQTKVCPQRLSTLYWGIIHSSTTMGFET